jgi:hypothetical protein
VLRILPEPGGDQLLEPLLGLFAIELHHFECDDERIELLGPGRAVVRENPLLGRHIDEEIF